MGLTPAFSSPAVCSGIFHSCIFHPWNYARAAFSTPAFSVALTEIWAVWRPQVGRKKVWRFLTQQFNCCTCAARCAGTLSCWNKVVTRHFTLRIAGSSVTSLWRREAASNKSVGDITRISCFVTTMKLPHALQIYSTVFVKKCMRLHFLR